MSDAYDPDEDENVIKKENSTGYNSTYLIAKKKKELMKPSKESAVALTLTKNSIAPSKLTQQIVDLIPEGTTLQITEAALEQLAKFSERMVDGYQASVPITCLGLECPYAHSCLPYYSLVQMGDGSLKSIKDIVVGDMVASLDKDSNVISIERVLATKNVGIKKVYKIQLGFKHSIECTADHPILIKHDMKRYPDVRTWKSINDGLTLSSHVAISFRTPSKSGTPIDPSICKLIGYHLSDGTYTKQLSFCNTRMQFITEYVECLEALGGTNPRIRERDRVNRRRSYEVFPRKDNDGTEPARELMALCGLKGVSGINKRVPKMFFDADLKSIALMINRYWSGDGNIGRGGFNAVCMSKEMLLDIQLLLSRFGIRSSIHSIRGGSSMPNPRDNYKIEISDSYSKSIFLDKIGIIFGKRKHCLKALEQIKHVDRHLIQRTDDIGWVKVHSIEELDDIECYDIQIENTESFITGGIVVHNCPLVKAKIELPLLEDCPVETHLFNQWTENKMIELGVEPDDELASVDRSQIREFAQLEIIQRRANLEMSLQPGVVTEKVIGFDNEGRPITSTEVNPRIDVIAKLSASKSRILNDLVGTRAARIKAGGGKKNMVNTMADLVSDLTAEKHNAQEAKRTAKKQSKIKEVEIEVIEDKEKPSGMEYYGAEE